MTEIIDISPFHRGEQAVQDPQANREVRSQSDS
jgi:hypothetical protein